jgi:hypothetical protein
VKVDAATASRRGNKIRASQRKSRKAMLAEVADFLLWTRQKSRAFVVFPKSDLLALRAPKESPHD